MLFLKKIKVGNIYKLIRVLRVLRSSKGRLNLHSFNHIYNVESWILIKYDVCDVFNSFVLCVIIVVVVYYNCCRCRSMIIQVKS